MSAVSSNWPSQAQNQLADEAIRVLPAIGGARERGDLAGVAELFKGLRDTCSALGVPEEQFWITVSVASVTWMVQMVRQRARDENLSTDAATTSLVAQALEMTLRDA